MNNEIEVGEYVRTIDGIIDKIKRLDCIILNKDITGEKHLYSYTDIIKHSNNIIDLIECGDYVNGENIIQVSKTFRYLFTNKLYHNDKTGEEKHIYFKVDDIKSIVTKEQFRSLEYII